MRATLATILLTAATGLASADGSGSATESPPPAGSAVGSGAGSGAGSGKRIKIPEEKPVPTTPLIIAGVALAAFAIVLLIGRRKKQHQQHASRLPPLGNLAEVRLVIETDERATVWTTPGARLQTDRLGEVVLELPVGSHQVTIEVGTETFTRTIQVPSIKRMRLPINLTKERLSRASSGEVPVVSPAQPGRPTGSSVVKGFEPSTKPPTSMARAYPDPSTQGQLGEQLAGLIDVELETSPAIPAKAPATKSAPLSLDYRGIAVDVAPPVSLESPAPAPALALELDEEPDVPVSNVPASTLELPPTPARPSPFAGAPPSAPAPRSSPLGDLDLSLDVAGPPTTPSPEARPAAPRVGRSERREAASAVADFALDELPSTPAKRPPTIGEVPELDLAPPTAQPHQPVTASYVEVGEFALGDFAPPAPAPAVELPEVTAASVMDLTLDELPVRRTPAPTPPAKPTPSIGDFELTPTPGSPPAARPSRPSAAPAAHAAGAIGNRYRKLGSAITGPHGAMYRGRDENAERDVWIEELPRDAVLAVPAATLARLEHANIHRFYEHVVDATKSYLVSEHVEGKSLEQVLAERGGVMSSLEAIAIVDQVCVALAYAHQQGIFHGNLRPACVWISGRTARVGGFGISFGATPYQAPELAKGAEPDVRSDLFSVGVTLAKLLTGSTPGVGSIDFPPDVPRSLTGMVRKLASREAMIRPNAIKVVRDTFSSLF